MLSDNIKALRMQKGLTQKELADLLFITPQAVSRWEKGDVEPSIEAIRSMATIFNVTADELIGEIKIKPSVETMKEIAEQTIEEKVVNIEQPKQFLAVCEICNQPIYESEEIVRNPNLPHNNSVKVACKSCVKKLEEADLKNKREFGLHQRIKSFVIGGIIIFIGILLLVAGINSGEAKAEDILILIVLTIMAFTFASCIILKNNFLGDKFVDIASWGFVTFPGIIFSFDLEGFIFLIAMKLLFVVLGYALGLATTLLALIICMPISLIVYPFALVKNLHNPEEIDDL